MHSSPPQLASPAGEKFCAACGARLVVQCRACGMPLGESGTKPVPPQAYTPPHLATKIRTFKSTLEDERKQVTVMFADLKGSCLLYTSDAADERCSVDLGGR